MDFIVWRGDRYITKKQKEMYIICYTYLNSDKYSKFRELWRDTTERYLFLFLLGVRGRKGSELASLR